MSLRRKYVNSSLKNKTCSKCKKFFQETKIIFIQQNIEPKTMLSITIVTASHVDTNIWKNEDEKMGERKNENQI